MGATFDGRAWTRYQYGKRTIGDWRELTGFCTGRNTVAKTKYAQAKPRTSARWKQNLSVPPIFLRNVGINALGNKYNAGRYFLECYLGRTLESFEVCRHGIAGPNDHSYLNVSPGDAVNNMIDDLENGKSETSLTYLIQAQQRLTRLISQQQFHSTNQ